MALLGFDLARIGFHSVAVWVMAHLFGDLYGQRHENPFFLARLVLLVWRLVCVVGTEVTRVGCTQAADLGRRPRELNRLAR